jgi:hypothetical protein
MHKTTSPPSVSIPNDVASFAAEQGVEVELPAVLAQAIGFPWVKARTEVTFRKKR